MTATPSASRTGLRSAGVFRAACRAPTAALAVCAAVVLGACGKPVRIKDLTPPGQTRGSAAKDARVMQPSEKVLPPPTMTPQEVRRALFEIAARQRRGEAGKVLDELAQKASKTRTLEARFLAAVAIPDTDSAWRALKAIADDQPRFYWAHAGIAAIYAGWRVRDHAEKELALCQQLGPDIPYTRTVRGNLWRNLGEHQQAVREYSAALRADAADAEARTGLALAQAELGNDGTLRASLERALQDVPTWFEAAEELALLLDEENDPDALTAWVRVDQISARNRTAKLALARLRGKEDPNGAIAAYEQAAKVSPLNRNELLALATLYRDQKRADDEVRTLEALVKLDAKDADPWRRMGEIFEARGDAQAADNAWRSVLANVPNDPQALLGLGRVSEKRLRIRQAMEFFQQAGAAGDAAGTKEFGRLAEACLVPSKPLAGRSLMTFNTAVADSLERIWNKRQAQVPGLQGHLSAKVQVDADGRATSVEIKENTLNDPFIEAHLNYALAQAAWPPELKNRRGVVLRWDLPPDRK